MESSKVDLVPFIRQKIAEDILPIGHDYWDVLGLVPPSAEAGDAPHEESALRLYRTMPYQDFINVYSILTADIISQVMYKNAKRLDVQTEDELEEWHKQLVLQNREIVRGSIVPILAHMLEAGVIMPGIGSII
jgi:hypothetical protein